MNLSGRNTDSITTLDIFEQKQKGPRYVFISQRF